MRQLLTGGQVFRESAFHPEALVIENGLVSGAGVSVSKFESGNSIDCRGLSILPGLVDVHVHLREPGFSFKETIASGTAAAAAGGVTQVCSMPNLSPPPDSLEHLKAQLEAIRRDARVRVTPYGCITRGQKGAGELADLEALAPCVAGFSDDGRGVQAEELMEAAMRLAKRLDKPIVAHCEDNTLLKPGGCVHEGRYAAAHGHVGISSESEWRQVERDLKLAARTGCRYHVCHISTKESVALIRQAKRAGVAVTCETAPHYLLLCEDDLQEDGRFKMNPPLRSAADRDALLEGLADGTDRRDRHRPRPPHGGGKSARPGPQPDGGGGAGDRLSAAVHLSGEARGLEPRGPGGKDEPGAAAHLPAAGRHRGGTGGGPRGL